MSEQNLEEKNKELKDKLLQNLAQLQLLTGIAVKLEKRIYEMEASVFWKARLASQLLWQHFKRTILTAKDSSSWFERLKYFLLKHIFQSTKRLLKVTFRNLYLMLEDQPMKIVPVAQSINNLHEEMIRINEDLEFFEKKPLISIILPVFNSTIDYLKATIDSVSSQFYTKWELCMACNSSLNEEIHKVLQEYKIKDPRIKVTFTNNQNSISTLSNLAIEAASGDYIVLLSQGDLITPNALYEVIRKINLHPEVDFIYSDEDRLNPDGSFCDACYKPDWSPDSLLSRNYINHFAIIRRELIDEVGRFREGFEGSEDYDLFLRVTELTNKIFHIPKILYHWRICDDSSALYSSSKLYASESAKMVLEETIQRRQLNAEIALNKNLHKNLPGYFTLSYIPKNPHKVSIIIPTKDNAVVLKKCLESLFKYTNYADFEVLVVSNNSKEKSLFGLLQEYASKYEGCFKYYEQNIPFNFSKLINDAARKALGDILLFLNNDTEIIHEGWLEEMLGQAERESIGAVGCKLLYPNDTIQHAGVGIGIGGVAGHLYVGEDRHSLGCFDGLMSINNYSAVTAACMMCRRSVFEEVNGFDENLKIEFNDTDFCLRLIERGYYNIYLPQVEIYHHESLTRGDPEATNESSRIHSEELNIFRNQWKKYINRDPFFNILSKGSKPKPNLNLRLSNYRLLPST